jgi:hypothetical protein
MYFWRPRLRPGARHVSKVGKMSQALRYPEVADLPCQRLSAGLLVPMQDWAFLHRCLVLDRPNTLESIGPIDILCGNLPKITLIIDSFLTFIKPILVLLANPFFNSPSLNFFQLESACSSSRHAASIGWEKGLVHTCCNLASLMMLIDIWDPFSLSCHHKCCP